MSNILVLFNAICLSRSVNIIKGSVESSFAIHILTILAFNKYMDCTLIISFNLKVQISFKVMIYRITRVYKISSYLSLNQFYIQFYQYLLILCRIKRTKSHHSHHINFILRFPDQILVGQFLSCSTWNLNYDRLYYISIQG